MMDLATWFFFGVFCMANAPHDAHNCTRLVFNEPMHTTDFRRTGPVEPLVFKTWDDCARALPEKFDKQKPELSEGATWDDTGCTKGN
jgi:hypothetical protein